MSTVRVGPFELHALLGVGGMGQVWRAVHADSGNRAAVKLLTGERATRDAFRRRLQDEVRATARLDHPNVVVVLDAGTTVEEVSLPTGDPVAVRSPWLALELATAGELGRLLRHGRGPARWSEVRALLQDALRALAHAHARGLAHLDVKPGNLLAFATGDGQRTWKLGDFGLAQAVRERRSSSLREAPTGSPHYMAPEQVRGAWRDFGPWTDLYGLACVAWELTTGGPPFREDLPEAHLATFLPTYRPRLTVPEGFEAWLGRCLRKRPVDRFQRAADALWALDQLGEPDDTGEIPSYLNFREASSETWFGTLSPSDSVALPDLPSIHGDETFLACDRVPPPIPEEPPKGDVFASFLRAGAGLGLFGLRQLPLVGRVEERMRLWRALREVGEGGRARLAMIRGPAGVGKSHLAGWLCERAHELGAAHVYRAYHDERPGPEHGLGAMVRRCHGTAGLFHVDARRRLAHRLAESGVVDEAEWEALADLAHPDPEHPSPAESTAHGLVLRMIERATADGRPAIVVLDGAQWGPESLGFARFVLASRDAWPVPVLLVLTVRDEALTRLPQESGWLAELAVYDLEAVAIALQPLGPAERVHLVRELLHLEAPLAARVEERTEGHPLFAVQLVGDWVRRGLLVPGADGYRLSDAASGDLPEALGSVYADEIARLVALLGEPAVQCLEVAAALGLDLQTEEWRAACRAAELEGALEALDALLVRGLAQARSADRGWSFAHGLLRSAFEDRARKGDRWNAWNRAVARALGDYSADPARRARLELAAGDEAAGASLLEAVEARIHGGRIREGLSLLGLAREALTDRDPDDPIRARLALVAASAWRFHGDLPEARRQLDEARARIEAGALTDLRVEWQYAEAELTRAAGEPQVDAIDAVIDAFRASGHRRRELQARLARAAHLQLAGRLEEALQTAISVAREAPDDSVEAVQGLYWEAQIHQNLGALDTAEPILRQALDRFEAMGQLQGAANALFDLAMIQATRGDLAASEQSIHKAEDLHRLTGSPQGLADCLNNQGEVHRARGELEQALSHYRRALGLYDVFGGDTLTTRLNIALTLVDRERWTEARVQAEQALEEAVEAGSVLWQGACHALLCPLTVHEPARFGTHLDRGREALEATGFAYPDIARALELAYQRAQDAGLERADDARELALDQYCRLGDTEAIHRLR